jgi:hypothetical protein
MYHIANYMFTHANILIMMYVLLVPYRIILNNSFITKSLYSIYHFNYNFYCLLYILNFLTFFFFFSFFFLHNVLF